jgi:photosystem II stability/assembly factor-like uncharacterized protein
MGAAILRADGWKPVAIGSTTPMFSGPNGTGDASVLVINPSDPKIIYAVALGSLWQTTDGGLTWHVSIDKPQEVVLAVAVSAAAPNSVYAIGLSSFYRSEDGGTTWNSSSVSKIDGVGPRDLAADAHDAGVLYAAVDRFCFVTCNDAGVLRSRDGGSHWTPIVLTGGMSRLIADPIERGIVYGRQSDGFSYRSDDAGASWHQIKNISPIAIDPTIPSTIYGAAGYFFRSTDRGEDWQQLGSLPKVNVSLPRDHEVSPSITAIAVNPTNPTVIDVGSDVGALHSTDGGLSWTVNNNGLCCTSQLPVPLTVFQMAYDQAGRLIATTVIGLVVYSSDEQPPTRHRGVRH